MPRATFQDKFNFYNGAESLEEAVSIVERIGQDKSRCYFIKFMNQYYAVFLENMNSKIIVGQGQAFYQLNGHLFQTTIEEFPKNYKIASRAHTKYTPALAEQLQQIDSTIEYFYFKTKLSKAIEPVTRNIGNAYLVLLGLTFASKYYSVKQLFLTEKYFQSWKELRSFALRTKGVVAVDPFRQIVQYENGSLGRYSFFFAYREGILKPDYTLMERNPYRPIKREWPSLTRYRAMYPNDFIDYPKPDLRDDKTVCKWCGKKLPPNRPNYCSDDCAINFSQATTVERSNALLPYKILCRDKFICQKCGKFLGIINEHGMKIPAPRKGDSEVHHINNVQNGGSDHQSNLTSRCSSCHDGENHNKVVEGVIILRRYLIGTKFEPKDKLTRQEKNMYIAEITAKGSKPDRKLCKLTYINSPDLYTQEQEFTHKHMNKYWNLIEK